MNIITQSVAILGLMGFLGGCASTGSMLSSQSGEIQVGVVNHGEMAPAQKEIEQVLDVWETPGGIESFASLEGLLSRYESGDGRFEGAVLTALALHHLDHGRRKDFLSTVGRLRAYVRPRMPLTRETTFILAIAAAMHGERMKAVPGRVIDPRMNRAISDLLNP